METELSGLSPADLYAALRHIERQMAGMSVYDVACSPRGERLYNLHIRISDEIANRNVVDLRGLA
jgi:hypothetical protein